MKEGSRTPWGRAQDVEPLPLGCYWVSTPGHGGLFVPSVLRDLVPPAAWEPHGERGWAEEDVAYAIAFLTLPPPVEEAAARWSVANGHSSPSAEIRRAEMARTVARYFGPHVLHACGFKLAPFEEVLRDWATMQERWGRAGKVPALDMGRAA
jgi:hypothetical protein